MTACDLPDFQRLLAVIARLRSPTGCPWDRQQTVASMAPHLLEEAFETVDAIARGEPGLIAEELGDVLTNVLLMAQIRAEAGDGDLEAIAGAVADKLVRRHPHVFGDQAADGGSIAFRDWERLKLQEPRPGAPRRSVLDGVPAGLPALLRASRVGEKAARVGFDWPDCSGPRAKVTEELAELDAAIAGGAAAAITAELGDLLFSIVNLARHLGCSAELALRGTVDRFQGRFAMVEAELGPDLKQRSLAELEAAWQRAKQAER